MIIERYIDSTLMLWASALTLFFGLGAFSFALSFVPKEKLENYIQHTFVNVSLASLSFYYWGRNFLNPKIITDFFLDVSLPSQLGSFSFDLFHLSYSVTLTLVLSSFLLLFYSNGISLLIIGIFNLVLYPIILFLLFSRLGLSLPTVEDPSFLESTLTMSGVEVTWPVLILPLIFCRKIKIFSHPDNEHYKWVGMILIWIGSIGISLGFHMTTDHLFYRILLTLMLAPFSFFIFNEILEKTLGNKKLGSDYLIKNFLHSLIVSQMFASYFSVGTTILAVFFATIMRGLQIQFFHTKLKSTFIENLSLYFMPLMILSCVLLLSWFVQDKAIDLVMHELKINFFSLVLILIFCWVVRKMIKKNNFLSEDFGPVERKYVRPSVKGPSTMMSFLLHELRRPMSSMAKWAKSPIPENQNFLISDIEQFEQKVQMIESLTQIQNIETQDAEIFLERLCQDIWLSFEDEKRSKLRLLMNMSVVLVHGQKEYYSELIKNILELAVLSYKNKPILLWIKSSPELNGVRLDIESEDKFFLYHSENQGYRMEDWYWKGIEEILELIPGERQILDRDGGGQILRLKLHFRNISSDS